MSRRLVIKNLRAREAPDVLTNCSCPEYKPCQSDLLGLGEDSVLCFCGHGSYQHSILPIIGRVKYKECNGVDITQAELPIIKEKNNETVR